MTVRHISHIYPITWVLPNSVSQCSWGVPAYGYFGHMDEAMTSISHRWEKPMQAAPAQVIHVSTHSPEAWNAIMGKLLNAWRHTTFCKYTYLSLDQQKNYILSLPSFLLLQPNKWVFAHTKAFNQSTESQAVATKKPYQAGKKISWSSIPRYAFDSRGVCENINAHW